ncbi:MAG TPA: lysylphosphatidylglycerol synthase transmembrane domain-containing protein [Gammaproteobacteria bacterium]|nr:lysylphosphatidylglycerol synthase transmembrane domain-containing protein [Gammaproteobacteria bacterium]
MVTERKTRSWPAAILHRGVGVVLAIAAAYWLLHGLDFSHLVALLRQARPGFLALVPAAVLLELWVRAWKWQQVLSATCRVSTHWVFRAQMIGYLPGLIVGFGTSVLARSWLLARRTAQRTSTVLATSTVDRLIDTFAFVAFVGLAAVFVILPSSQTTIVQAVRLAGGIILILAVLALTVLIHLHQSTSPGWLKWLLCRLPARAARTTEKILEGFSGGLTWPRSPLRRGGIIGTALLIKAIATTQYLWASLAFDVRLPAGNYLFIMVFLGALGFVAFFVRIPGSGLLASLFVLELVGVPKTQALAITLVVVSSFLLVIATFGGIALLFERVDVQTLRALTPKIKVTKHSA